MKIRVKTVEGGMMPKRMTSGAAGFDCYARSVFYDGKSHLYNLGFSIEIPEGYVGLLFPRSSVYRTGLLLPNCVGVIDSDFRGELTARFYHDKNRDFRPYVVGDRVVQLVIIKLPEFELVESESLSDTARGDGGYGSTGNR